MKGWKTSTLGDLCEMYQPKAISGKDMVEDGAYPVYGANGVIGRYSQFNHEEPQLLITCRGATCGSVNISAPRSWVTGNAMVVRPKNGSLGMRYLEYLFRGGIDISKAITGAAQPQITRTNLAPLEVSYPVSCDEQHRIVGILDEAFAGIATAKANAEKNLQNARAIFESHLQSVFSKHREEWVQRKLGDLCTVARGGSPRPIKKFLTAAADGINWIKIGDATASGKYVYTTEEKIIPEGAKRSRIVQDGDFLLSNSMSFGRPYIMRTSGCIHDGWLVLSDYATQLDQDYLYYVLGSQFVYQQFDRLAAGSTVRNLNIELASRVDIPVPTIKEQQKIAQGFEALSAEIRHLESIYQRKLAALEALKKSLLHDAFRGAL
jgi:type I restriction enzyme, S subunit